MPRDYNVECRNCTRTVHAGNDCCLWCGTTVMRDEGDPCMLERGCGCDCDDCQTREGEAQDEARNS